MYQAPTFKNIKESIRLREKTSGHKVFGPSQIHRIIACPASFRETLKAPIKPSGQAAKHGTMLHEVMESILGMAIPSTEENHMYVNLSDEDKMMVDDCFDFVKPLIGNRRTRLEVNVSLESIGIPEIEGTVDLLVFGGDSHPIIVDWKFGGTPVFVENNPQLICYAMGAVLALQKTTAKPVNVIETYIAQPALNYFKSHSYSINDLRAFAITLKDTIQNALSPNATYNPGRKQCQFCNAKMTCRARMDGAYDNARTVFEAVNIIESTPTVARAEWVHVLEVLQEVEAVARDIRKFFHNEIWEGRNVPGYKLVHGRGTRKFKNELEAFKWINAMYSPPASDMYVTKPKTVAQIEKSIKGIKKDEDFKQLIETKPGAPQLVKEDDKREAISVKSIFESVD